MKICSKITLPFYILASFLLTLGYFCLHLGPSAFQKVRTFCHWRVIENMPLSFPTPGTSLSYVVSRGNRNPEDEAILVTTPESAFVLTSFAQLRGLVHITDAGQALQYVRLSTNPGYIWAWSKGLEILSWDQLKEKPFGNLYVPAYFHDKVSVPSGRYGILSPVAFHAGGFSPPTVKAVPGGFEIIRWKCVGGVQKCRETVKADGSYAIEILLSRPLPKLPATEWQQGNFGRE